MPWLKAASLLLALLFAGCTKSDARRSFLTSPDDKLYVVVDDYSEGTALYVIPKGREITESGKFMIWNECNDVTLAWQDKDTLLISYDNIDLAKFYSSGLDENVRNFRPLLCDRRFNKCDAGLKIVYKLNRCIYPY
jgi:hypothetical protein